MPLCNHIALAILTSVIVVGAGSSASAQGGAHRHSMSAKASQGDTAATRAFKAAHARMMRNMAKPFTGNPDVDFRTHMIPHHQGAMDMAWVALRYAKDPWTRQAAQVILVDQQQEIAQFQSELARRGVKPPPGGRPRYILRSDAYPDADQTRAEETTGSPDELVTETWAPGSGVPRQGFDQPVQRNPGVDRSGTREFKAAHMRMMQNMDKPFTGDPDVDFRTHMIPHHQGAIDMARVALRHARNPWTRQAAQAIVTSQEREVYHFRNWLGREGVTVP